MHDYKFGYQTKVVLWGFNGKTQLFEGKDSEEELPRQKFMLKEEVKILQYEVGPRTKSAM